MRVRESSEDLETSWWLSANALLAYLAGVNVLLHLFDDPSYGYFRDELYYIACSDHLAWGYVDHPPLSIFLLAAERWLFGDSLFAIRLLAVLATAASVVLTGLLARALGGGRAAQWLAALTYLITGWSLAFGSFYSMNAFDALLWLVALLIVARMLRRNDDRQWLAFGIVCGIGLLNKFSIGFLAFGVVVGIALSPSRTLLWSRWLLIGAALALLLFLPHIAWQAANGFPTLEFMSNAARLKITAMPPLAFAAALVTEADPVTLPVWLAGLGYLLLAPSMRTFRALGFAFVAILILFLVQTAKPYYLAPAFPILLAAGGIAIETLARQTGAWIEKVATAWLVLGGLFAIPATLPLLPPATLVRYQHFLGVEIPHEERGAAAALPQILADRFGWENLVASVAKVYHSLPDDERARAGILAGNYGEAGAIDFFGPRFGLPKAISGHNNYWLWGPRDATGDVVIVIGATREQLSGVFDRVDLAETVVSAYAQPSETDLPIFVAYGLKRPLNEIWPAVKLFM